MNYELAKELKDKGFPQEGIKTSLGNHGTWLYGPDGIAGPNEAYVPSLSELIEACGENLCELIFLHDQNRIIAHGATSLEIERDGITPEEAVAALWLALNSKPPTPNV